MAPIQIESLPRLDHPALVAGFTGWPDAAEVGSAAIAYLVRTMSAERFATIDSEAFFAYVEARPSTVVLGEEQRALTWPGGEFFAARDPSGRDLVLFLGREPSLRWRSFAEELLALAEELQASPVFTLGGTYDRVSHRGSATISGWSPTQELRHTLIGLGVRFSVYQGPAAIQSALIDACARRGLPSASLWGHAPHYVTGIPNPKVVHALLQRLSTLLGISVDLSLLESAAQALEAQIDAVLSERADLREYLDELERHEQNAWPPLETAPQMGPLEAPSTERIIEELEAFVREVQEEDEDDEEA